MDEYLELKRQSFPRFYFLSSDELIDILANSGNWDVIQSHMKTMFDNIHHVKISPENELVGMKSGEGEYIPFEPRGVQISTQKPIEWHLQ